MAVQAILEVPLFELQTEKARSMDITTSSVCCICGKKIKESSPKKFVHLLTNGNIVSTDEDMSNSQGFFPIGIECAKKLILNFSFA